MYFDRTEPTDTNNYHTGNALLLLDSYFQLLQHTLLPRASNLKKLAKDIYHAPFVVLAHDVAADPTFFYANLKAQQLFKMTWAEMVCLPSRLSAEPVAQEERQQLLALVTSNGYIDDYSGIRVSSTGERFLIERATVWNLISSNGAVVGQAATFSAWKKLN